MVLWRLRRRCWWRNGDGDGGSGGCARGRW